MWYLGGDGEGILVDGYRFIGDCRDCIQPTWLFDGRGYVTRNVQNLREDMDSRSRGIDPSAPSDLDDANREGYRRILRLLEEGGGAQQSEQPLAHVQPQPTVQLQDHDRLQQTAQPQQLVPPQVNISTLPSQSEFYMCGAVPVDRSSGNFSSAECTICLEPLVEGIVKFRACDHMFHAVCVMGWFDSNAPRAGYRRGTCPNCPYELYELNEPDSLNALRSRTGPSPDAMGIYPSIYEGQFQPPLADERTRPGSVPRSEEIMNYGVPNNEGTRAICVPVSRDHPLRRPSGLAAGIASNNRRANEMERTMNEILSRNPNPPARRNEPPIARTLDSGPPIRYESRRSILIENLISSEMHNGS